MLNRIHPQKVADLPDFVPKSQHYQKRCPFQHDCCRRRRHHEHEELGRLRAALAVTPAGLNARQVRFLLLYDPRRGEWEIYCVIDIT